MASYTVMALVCDTEKDLKDEKHIRVIEATFVYVVESNRWAKHKYAPNEPLMVKNPITMPPFTMTGLFESITKVPHLDLDDSPVQQQDIQQIATETKIVEWIGNKPMIDAKNAKENAQKIIDGNRTKLLQILDDLIKKESQNGCFATSYPAVDNNFTDYNLNKDIVRTLSVLGYKASYRSGYINISWETKTPIKKKTKDKAND